MDVFAFDPETDLEVTARIAAPPAAVWRGLTEPHLIERWFCPKPWAAHHVEIQPIPGGVFHTPMRGPKGEEIDEGPGCILVAVPGKVLAFTDMLGPGFHPKAGGFMTGVYTLEPTETGTTLTAMALHSDRATRDQHAEMGFHDGWSAALAQLAELAERL